MDLSYRSRQPRNRQGKARVAMTAINFRIVLSTAGFDDDQPIIDERQCRRRAPTIDSEPVGWTVRSFVKWPDVGIDRNEELEIV
jgi:hypothetical protein